MRGKLVEKINNALSSPVIGDVSFDNEELEEIRSEIQDKYDEKLRYGMNALEVLRLNGKALTVLIVNYARKWDNNKEKNFWTSIFEKVLEEPDFSQSKLYDTFDRVFGDNRVFITPAEKRSFYSTFLYHALAPASSFEAFVRMLWEEFYLDPDLMNGSYDESDPLIPQMTRWLKNHFSEQAEDLEHDFELSKKSYSIRSGIKYAFMQYDEEEMTTLLRRLLCRMDNWYYNESSTLETGYLETLVDETLTRITRLAEKKSSRDYGTRRVRALPDLFRVNPIYQMDEEKGPLLVIPESRVFDENIEQLQIQIYLGYECLTAFKRFVMGHDLRHRLEKIEVPLLPLLQSKHLDVNHRLKIRLLLKAGDRVILDTEEKLYRSYLLFDGVNEIQKLNCSVGKAYTVLSLDSELASDLEKMERGYAFPIHRKLISVIYPHNGDKLHTQTRTTVFSDGTLKSFVHLEGKLIAGLRIPYQDEQYPVYRDIPSLSFASFGDISKYGLFVNGKFHGSLKSYAEQINTNQWTITIPEDIDRNIFNVIIQNMLADRAIDQQIFGVAQGVNVLKPSTVCYGKHRNFGIQFGEETHLLSLGRQGEPAEFNGYYVYADVLRWRLDDTEWRIEEMPRPNWYRSAPLHNNVILEIDKASLGKHSIKVLLNRKPVELKKGSDQMYLLGDAITEASEDMCEIVITIDDKQEVPILKVAKKACFIGKPDLFADDGLITFDARDCFIGDTVAAPKFCVVMSDGETDFKIETELYGQTEFPAGFEEGVYDCTTFIKQNFLSDDWVRFWIEEDVVLGNPYREYFDDCKLTLVRTKFCEKPGDKPETVKLSGFRLFDISYEREEMGLYIYKAKLSGLQKRPMEICFSWDGNGDEKPVIKLRSADEEKPLMVSVDAKTRTLVAQKTDAQKGLYRCAGIYTKVE